MTAPTSQRLKTVTADPHNAETPLSALAEPVTPAPLFYVRNHFPVPEADQSEWRLRVDGLVERRLDWDLSELDATSPSERLATLECAGNGRAGLEPPVTGTPWGLGAVSTGRFGGVPLAGLLDAVGVVEGAVEVLFTGRDGYQRSLPLETARRPDLLLARTQEGEPLTPEHGHPLRLVVPHWYAMASVKWLERITLLGEPFTGRFQSEEYVYREASGVADGTPVREVRVRSLIARPEEGAELAGGEIEIVGSAWSGAGGIARVEISTDDGATWRGAALQPPEEAGGRTLFRLPWRAPGPGWYTLISRATDAAGRTQPEAPFWNRLGYGNNAVHRVRVHVGG